MEENTKAGNMNLDEIITDYASSEEQHGNSTRVLQVPTVAWYDSASGLGDSF